jgi:uncharacterized membrane protein YbhN (UPF0104 family)
MSTRVAERYKNWAKSVLKFAITGAALVIVFRKIDFSAILEIYKTADIFLLLLALVLFTASKALSALRLNLFFHKTDLPLRQVSNLELYLLGMFYNLFLPGGIGGDGYKIYLLNKDYQVKAKRVLAAVFADRASGIVVLWVIALIFILFVKTIPYRYLAAASVPVLLGGLYIGLKIFFKDYVNIYLPVVLYSSGVQLMQVLCAFSILMAFHFDGDSLPYLILFLISSIVAILPITIGGAGAREITFLFGAQYMGVDQSLSVGLSLMFYFISVIVSFCGLYYVIRPYNRVTASPSKEGISD